MSGPMLPKREFSLAATWRNHRARGNARFKEFEEVEELSRSLAKNQSTKRAGTRGGLGLDGFHPEDPRRWRGKVPPEMREMIAMSLQENDIFARYEERDATTEVYVLPEDEERAREIVREIVEGQAPKHIRYAAQNREERS